MKKIFFILQIFFQVFLFAEDETDLEKVWSLVVKENPDVQAAAFDRNMVETALSYFWQERIPSVLFSASSSFLQYGGDINPPQSIYSSLEINEKLPGGLYLALEPQVTLSKGSNENDSFVFSDTEKLGISISQTVNPYWIQGVKKEPEQESVELTFKLYDIRMKSQELVCITMATDYFVRLRQYYRKKDSYEKMIVFYEELSNAWTELRKLDRASDSEVYSSRENLYYYQKELYDCILEIESLYSQFENLLGKSKIDDAKANAFNTIVFLSELPEPKEVFPENPELAYWNLMKQKNDTDYVLGKQTASPIISLTASIPIHEKESDYFMNMIYTDKSKSWSVGIGIDFSAFLSKNHKQLKRDFELSDNEFERRIHQKQGELLRERKYYENLILFCEKQLELLQEGYKNKLEILEAMEEMYERGECSKIDLLNAKIDSQIRQNDFYIQQDSLWFYKWMWQNSKE